ncbi:MAG: cyclic nucleotide-binding domain-containing protein [Thaumarchaeota archaeon]|nr:cyclic nucleotide-binding domain-containing protein [Nitrososphaerota archaeon]
MPRDSHEQVTEMLRKVPLFSMLSGKQLKTIAKSGKDLSYIPGQEIIQEGALGVGFFLILDGHVRVRKGKKTLAELKTGDFFGEMSLFDEQPRSATVEATGDTKCLGITAWSFIGMVKSNPDIAVNLMKEMAVRLRASNKALAE